MKERKLGKTQSGIPLWTFGFLCLSTILLSHLRVTIGKKSEPAAPANGSRRNWTIWNYQQANECGLFLKAVIMVSSPLLPLTSTLLLVLGLAWRNVYLFLPWLLLTAKGSLVVQKLNLVEMYQNLWGGKAECEEWKYFFVYSAVLVMQMATCSYYCEVFRVFRDLWANFPVAIEEEKRQIAVKYGVGD